MLRSQETCHGAWNEFCRDAQAGAHESTARCATQPRGRPAQLPAASDDATRDTRRSDRLKRADLAIPSCRSVFTPDKATTRRDDRELLSLCRLAYGTVTTLLGISSGAANGANVHERGCEAVDLLRFSREFGKGEIQVRERGIALDRAPVAAPGVLSQSVVGRDMASAVSGERLRVPRPPQRKSV